MVIGTYGEAFRQERNLHRGIFRHLPNGLSIRGTVYALVLVLVILVLDHLPGTHELLSVVSPFFRYVVIPAGAGWLMLHTPVDGRMAHLALLDVAGMMLRPRRTVNGRRVGLEGDRSRERVRFKLRPDTTGSALPRARFRGPVTLKFADPVRFTFALRGHRIVRPNGTASTYDVPAGERVEIKP